MFATLGNIFRVPELRRRLIITVLLLWVCRIGVYVPVPGVDPVKLEAFKERVARGPAGPMMSMVNLFAGGALENCAVFGLGVMPYISASIIFQLLASVIPALERLQKEGEAGRRKINQYTRYATVLLCFIQAAMLLGSMSRRGATVFDDTFGASDLLLAALLLTAGTMFLMWIGEQIDEYGIGNGVSLIIMIGIIARLPVAVLFFARSVSFSLQPAPGEVSIAQTIIMLAFFLAVVVGIIFITNGHRRIPFQQAKMMRGRRLYGGMRHYLPLQVNAAGVIPIIFASSLLVFPHIILGWAVRGVGEDETGFFPWLFKFLNDSLESGTFLWTLLYVALIFFFCYFWTAIQFNPTDMAENLKDHGSFIPGIRPGKRTAEYLERVMSRITLPGAAFLAAIAILPNIVANLIGGEFRNIARFYGGTSLLIVVGVALDLVRKIESQLLMRHYEGFTKAGRRW